MTEQRTKIFSKKSNFLYFLFWVILNYAFINTAFLNEDAFITFRSVDNLLNGFGPVWNIGERVQVYTHPLWYYLLAIGVAIFNDSYWVSIGLSYICLNFIFFFLIKINEKAIGLDQNKSFIFKNYLLLFILVLSRSFIDYSSSGLENPLIHLLLCIYFYIYINENSITKRFFWTSFIYGLIFLTRPDAIFLVTASSIFLLFEIIRERKFSLTLTTLSILPVLFWEIFSIIYYGSPVPNTALAKTNIDYTFIELSKNSIYFYIENFKNDALTSIAIISGIILGLCSKNKNLKVFSIGLILQQLYIFKVGGDYMLGRFLSSSFLLSTLILLTINFKSNFYPRVKFAFISIFGIFFIVQAQYTLYPAVFFKGIPISHGISDVRTYYYKSLGVLSVLYYYHGDYTNHPWMKEGKKFKNKKLKKIIPNIGMMPWAAGENMYWTDQLALSEPFLARLPAMQNMRIGHYKRAIPDGYYKTIVTDINYIKSRKLSKLYDDISITVHGDIWTKKRWEAIWRLNTGYYNNLNNEFNRNSDNIINTNE